MRHVRGSLFVDYVRMLRAYKRLDWRADLAPEDLRYTDVPIIADEWYPMATFERMGNAILRHIAGGQLFPVQLWGRYSASQVRVMNPTLLVAGDPGETLTRFHALRQTYFDFEAHAITDVSAQHAEIAITYHMGMPAEEAAAHQTMGFFEGLLQLAGAQNVSAELPKKSWAGDERTALALRWRPPAAL